jgi:23S rRNA (adenine-N6)-dimethyltransferase
VDNARLTWGWHQLDSRWAERIVAEAGLSRGALVLDVGAGLGALTEPLMTAGARVIAVESHPGRAAQLRRRFGRGLIVVEADGADLRLPRRPFHVVANPPFAIISALLHRLLHSGSRLVSAHVVLQDQVVRRWTGPDAPGARRWARTFAVCAGRPLPRSAFEPPPRVPCRLLVIRRR